jgi:hypothetical protein
LPLTLVEPKLFVTDFSKRSTKSEVNREYSFHNTCLDPMSEEILTVTVLLRLVRIKGESEVILCLSETEEARYH